VLVCGGVRGQRQVTGRDIRYRFASGEELTCPDAIEPFRVECTSALPGSLRCCSIAGGSECLAVPESRAGIAAVREVTPDSGSASRVPSGERQKSQAEPCLSGSVAGRILREDALVDRFRCRFVVPLDECPGSDERVRCSLVLWISFSHRQEFVDTGLQVTAADASDRPLVPGIGTRGIGIEHRAVGSDRCRVAPAGECDRCSAVERNRVTGTERVEFVQRHCRSATLRCCLDRSQEVSPCTDHVAERACDLCSLEQERCPIRRDRRQFEQAIERRSDCRVVVVLLSLFTLPFQRCHSEAPDRRSRDDMVDETLCLVVVPSSNEWVEGAVLEVRSDLRKERAGSQELLDCLIDLSELEERLGSDHRSLASALLIGSTACDVSSQFERNVRIAAGEHRPCQQQASLEAHGRLSCAERRCEDPCGFSWNTGSEEALCLLQGSDRIGRGLAVGSVWLLSARSSPRDSVEWARWLAAPEASGFRVPVSSRRRAQRACCGRASVAESSHAPRRRPCLRS